MNIIIFSYILLFVSIVILLNFTQNFAYRCSINASMMRQNKHITQNRFEYKLCTELILIKLKGIRDFYQQNESINCI